MLCTDSLLYLTAAAVWISVFVVIIASVVVVVVVASLLEIFLFTWLIERFVIVVYHSSSPGDGLCVFSRSLEVCCCVFLLSIGHHIFIIMLVINYFCFHLERCMMITIASWSTTVRYNIANHFFGCSCSCVMCVRGTATTAHRQRESTRLGYQTVVYPIQYPFSLKSVNRCDVRRHVSLNADMQSN